MSEILCLCEPCPGRGNDGHGMTHCAECCWGTRVIADLDCPTHGMPHVPDASSLPSAGPFAAEVDDA